MPKTAIHYRVWNDGNVLTGDARKVLEAVRAAGAKGNAELRSMDVREYAQALIDDAPYFLPEDLLDTLKEEDFSDEFDRALNYLVNTPSSRVRILSWK